MRTPDEWLAEQIGDRHDDFSAEDMVQAREWIGRIQRDAARPCPIRALVILVVVLALALAWRLLVRP